MEKHLIDRRVAQMEAEGVVFHYNVNVGVDLSVEDLTAGHDAVILAGGAKRRAICPCPAATFSGVHFAMDFLPEQNRRVSGEPLGPMRRFSPPASMSSSSGGGDTGSDCIGTSRRSCALSVTQLEIMPRPPEKEDKLRTWPDWPLKLRTSTSHDEGAEREFA